MAGPHKGAAEQRATAEIKPFQLLQHLAGAGAALGGEGPFLVGGGGAWLHGNAMANQQQFSSHGSGEVQSGVDHHLILLLREGQGEALHRWAQGAASGQLQAPPERPMLQQLTAVGPIQGQGLQKLCLLYQSDAPDQHRGGELGCAHVYAQKNKY